MSVGVEASRNRLGKEQFLANMVEISRRLYKPSFFLSLSSDYPEDCRLDSFNAIAKKGSPSYTIILTGSPWYAKNTVIFGMRTILEAHNLEEGKNYKINTTSGLLGGTTQIIIVGVSAKFVSVIKDISEVLEKRAYFSSPIIVRLK